MRVSMVTISDNPSGRGLDNPRANVCMSARYRTLKNFNDSRLHTGYKREVPEYDDDATTRSSGLALEVSNTHAHIALVFRDLSPSHNSAMYEYVNVTGLQILPD